MTKATFKNGINAELPENKILMLDDTPLTTMVFQEAISEYLKIWLKDRFSQNRITYTNYTATLRRD